MKNTVLLKDLKEDVSDTHVKMTAIKTHLGFFPLSFDILKNESLRTVGALAYF